MNWTAVVLAGSRPGRDVFAEQFGTDLKALVPLYGEPMVNRPVRALLESDRIGRILVLSQSPERISKVLPKDLRISVGKSRKTIAETLLGLIADEPLQWPLLVTTADHAFLDQATIDEFCDGAMASDIAIGVVERSRLMRRLPASRRTWLKFRGGAYTGANLFGLSSNQVVPAIEMWSSVEQDRKKALRLISLLGPGMFAAVVLRLVTLDQMLETVGARLGLSVTAVRLTNALAGVDVDKPADHELAEALLGGQA